MTQGNPTNLERLKALSTHDFLMLGMNQIAYIKPLEKDDGGGYALHGANGQLLVTENSRDHIAELALQNDLQPVTLH